MGIYLFSSKLQDWLSEKPISGLGPGQKPSAEEKKALEANLQEKLWEKGEMQIADRDMAGACETGLWLAYNDLWKAHDICNDIATAEGSYWHAIMHRREPDIPNSNYWFYQVGTHPIWNNLLLEAKQCLEQYGTNRKDEERFHSLLTQSQWEPIEFNRICGEVRGSGGSAEEVCVQIQEREWHLLFEHCYLNAVKGV